MEAFLAQVAAAARKASDQGYSTQGRPPVQGKSAAAGRPLQTGVGRPRPPSAPATNEARNGEGGPNSHKHKALNPEGCTEQCHSTFAYLPVRCHIFANAVPLGPGTRAGGRPHREGLPEAAAGVPEVARAAVGTPRQKLWKAGAVVAFLRRLVLALFVTFLFRGA